jgi:hypothetical protein
MAGVRAAARVGVGGNSAVVDDVPVEPLVSSGISIPSMTVPTARLPLRCALLTGPLRTHPRAQIPTSSERTASDRPSPYLRIRARTPG